MNILFINNNKHNCGVYQYGVRLFDILNKTNDIGYQYLEIEHLDNYLTINFTKFNAVIYNYHEFTMPWLNNDTIQKKTKNIGLQHDIKEYSFFDYIGMLDLTMTETNNNFTVPRPLFEKFEKEVTNDTIQNFINYKEDNVPIFGSFGFGFNHKGFHKIVKMVSEQYKKAIIKFIMPQSDYCPYNYNETDKICKQYLGNDIKLLITHEFFSNNDILNFLDSNTMNIFLYETVPGAGLSSVIDYALSVKKPIGISNSNMFRHIYSAEICLYNISINQCIQNSVKYCSQFIDKFSNDELRNKFKNILLKI